MSLTIKDAITTKVATHPTISRVFISIFIIIIFTTKLSNFGAKINEKNISFYNINLF
tara:strand:+ start:2151 stop:2321 length:171 start_codon:yes stop_codon:yes gene_type:complete